MLASRFYRNKTSESTKLSISKVHKRDASIDSFIGRWVHWQGGGYNNSMLSPLCQITERSIRVCVRQSLSCQTTLTITLRHFVDSLLFCRTLSLPFFHASLSPLSFSGFSTLRRSALMPAVVSAPIKEVEKCSDKRFKWKCLSCYWMP